MGNTIDINGKRYDARSGALLGDSPVSSIVAARRHATHQGRVIDGFVKKKPALAAPTVKSGTLVVPNSKAVISHNAAPKMMEPVKFKKKPNIQRAAAKQAAARQPEKAKTLMRSVVHKPEVAMKKAIKTQSASEIAAAPVSELTPQLKKAAHIVDDKRLGRARQTDRSTYVRRFSTLQQNYPVSHARVAATSVAARPAATQAPAAVAVQAAPKAEHHSKATDLFEAAVANASSHEQPKVKAKRSARQKFVGVSAGIAAFLVLSGFIAYTNMSNIEVKLASVRVGFSVQLPNYAPTGYALTGGVQAKSSVATATYRSGSSSYTLQQQTSDWDSQTLYDNVVAISSDQNQKLNTNGQTVYVYGHSAAWVNGGVLYSLKTDGNISNQEILSIASSI